MKWENDNSNSFGRIIMIQTRGHIVVGQEKIKHLFLIFIVILVLRRGYIEINLSILYRVKIWVNPLLKNILLLLLTNVQWLFLHIFWLNPWGKNSTIIFSQEKIKKLFNILIFNENLFLTMHLFNKLISEKWVEKIIFYNKKFLINLRWKNLYF